jgi:hypothetical protein
VPAGSVRTRHRAPPGWCSGLAAPSSSSRASAPAPAPWGRGAEARRVGYLLARALPMLPGTVSSASYQTVAILL